MKSGLCQKEGGGTGRHGGLGQGAVLAAMAGGTHSLKQWAADTSHLAPMMVAPQKCS